jgi:hypothetical protein
MGALDELKGLLNGLSPQQKQDLVAGALGATGGGVLSNTLGGDWRSTLLAILAGGGLGVGASRMHTDPEEKHRELRTIGSIGGGALGVVPGGAVGAGVGRILGAPGMLVGGLGGMALGAYGGSRVGNALGGALGNAAE